MCQFELAWQPWQYTMWQNNFVILTLKQFHEIFCRKFIFEKLKIQNASYQVVDDQKFEH